MRPSSDKDKDNDIDNDDNDGIDDGARTPSAAAPAAAPASASAVQLRALGFCGADDSVRPRRLVLYAHLYPVVEFGVLFRPDREGLPRYPTEAWVRELSEAVNAQHAAAAASAAGKKMKLAAHLCGTRVDEVLRGDDGFVGKLEAWGFGRVQINATAVNGVDVSVFDDPGSSRTAVERFAKVAGDHPGLEFILQQNDETRPLWEGFLLEERRCNDGGDDDDDDEAFPTNVSFLLDESKGTGKLPEEGRWPPVPAVIAAASRYHRGVGYAGGIGPSNVRSVLGSIRRAVAAAAEEAEEETADDDRTTTTTTTKTFWIDMESSLRSTNVVNGADVFDLGKCYDVLETVCSEGCAAHPPVLGG